MQAGGNDVSFASKESSFFEGPRLKLKMNSSPVTAIEEEESSNLIVYPNPSDGQFLLNKEVVWEVFNIQGIAVKSGNSSKINLEGFSKGIYFLKSGTVTQKLLIK